MLLEIDDWRSVNDLQYRFNKCFSNLNLQIFDGIQKEELPLGGEYQLEQVRKKHEPGVLSIKSWQTVADVTARLKQGFGLHTRIVLIDGGKEVWRPSFNNLTLQQLNDKGNARLATVDAGEPEELEGW